MSQAAADALVAEAEALVRAERFAEAVTRFERAVAAYPPHALAWRGLGQARLCLGRPHEAAAAFDRAIGLGPASATALWGGAVAHAELGNRVVAQDYLRRTFALQPTWMAMALQTPALAKFMQTSARAAASLHRAFGAFSSTRYQHGTAILEVGRIPDRPTPGQLTFVTIGLSNIAWREPERPRVELVLASTIDSSACADLLANLACLLAAHRQFPEPGMMVRDVVAESCAGELAARLPHVYIQVPRAWGVALPLDEDPPAITLARAVPVSEREYELWRDAGDVRFDRVLAERAHDLADLARAGA